MSFLSLHENYKKSGKLYCEIMSNSYEILRISENPSRTQNLPRNFLYSKALLQTCVLYVIIKHMFDFVNLMCETQIFSDSVGYFHTSL